MRRWTLAVLISLASLVAAAREPARVMIVGTYHFSNPGRDMHNVRSVDVLSRKRQQEVQAVVDALARFGPTKVAVEWPAALTHERYAQFRAGSLAPSTNEVVQLGFRLAKQRGLGRVHGIDVDGDFPYGPVKAWADANGRASDLDRMSREVGEMVKHTETLQAEGSIGDALRYMNSPEAIALSRSFYGELVRFGSGDEQPGVALLAAWERRNLEICARLVQALGPGDRAVVFYGQGHAHLLRRCVQETPGLELVETSPWLGQESA